MNQFLSFYNELLASTSYMLNNSSTNTEIEKRSVTKFHKKLKNILLKRNSNSFHEVTWQE